MDRRPIATDESQLGVPSYAKRGDRAVLLNYVRIARVDHWFKNVFMLPGLALAYLFRPTPAIESALLIVLAVASTCLVASANYVINEWLDREYDKYHPVKRERPSVSHGVRAGWVYFEYGVLALAGLALAASVSRQFLVVSLLLLMGILYNVQPFRTKDKPYLDVLSESFNNPLRLLLGWSILVHDGLPPSSILLAFWMGGAFLMAVKRYSEYRFIDDPARAGLYRNSFRYYSERTLLLSSFFYADLASFFLAVFLIKYRIEFILTFPVFALLFVWYLAIGMRQGSVAKDPEKIFANPRFMGLITLLSGMVAFLFFVDIPILHVLVERIQY